MQNAIISIFCHVDDFLKALSWKDHWHCRLMLSEIITIALVAARFFSGNLESARIFLFEHGYIPRIGKSRLNRRLHGIPDFFWHFIVSHLSKKHSPDNKHFLVDSFPIAICHPVRASRRSLFKGKKYLGYNASKKTWFTGLKVTACLEKALKRCNRRKGKLLFDRIADSKRCYEMCRDHNKSLLTPPNRKAVLRQEPEYRLRK